MTHEQKKTIGINYVFDLLEPFSATGKTKLKNLDFFSSRNGLESELNNVNKIFSLLIKDAKACGEINHKLSFVKDLSNTFTRLSKGAVMEETELFEIKAFLEASLAVEAELFRIKLDTGGLNNLEFADILPALKILSKGQGGGFFISEEYSPLLKNIRKEKESVNRLMASEKYEQKKESLKKKHLEIWAEEVKEETEVRKTLSALLSPFADGFLKNSDTIGSLDLIIQKADLAVRKNCVMPVIGDTLSLIGARHPETEDFVNGAGRKFTAVSIECGLGSTVITGANMGGKTTALKTIALNAALARLGFFVFASAATVPFFDFIEITPDGFFEKGLSSFANEVVWVNSVYLSARKSNGLLLIDEFGKGTNAEEGAKILKALVKAFNQTQSAAVLSTHFDGVAEFSNAHYQVAGLNNADFKALKAGLGAGGNAGVAAIGKAMDYGLIKIGKSQKIPRDAIKICGLLGLDKEILNNITF